MEHAMLKAALAVAAAAVLVSGCQLETVVSGETRRETKSLDLDKSEAARVEIRMGAGELRVKSGTPKLLDAEFQYNVDDWKPVVEYQAGSPRSHLTISQPKGSGNRFGRTVYIWDVNLNGQLPMDVSADLGAGDARLELGGMSLRSVEVRIGAGEATLDLRGQPKSSYDVTVRGGVGQTTIYLPRDAAVSATAKGGIGSISAEGLEKRNDVWINPDRPEAPVTVRLDVKGGIGEIRMIR